jgi:hypothetical protein
MNYTYKIKKSRYYNGLIIAEYWNNVKTRVWDLNDMFSNSTFMQSNVKNKNFKEAKNWLIENHPELLI